MEELATSASKARRDSLAGMRIALYLVVVASLSALAWRYPFLFELPLIAAIGGAFWLVPVRQRPPDRHDG